jgi:dCTP deaminase
VVLSDRSIREEVEAGRIRLEPFDDALVQPCSVDVRCDHRFRVFHPGRYPFIDVRLPMPDLTELVELSGERAFILHPGEFVLGATLERLSLPDDLVARLDGKSSLGRLGLQVHSTAGLADPGFEGQITLELSNVASLPIAIYPGMRIAQLVFERLTTPAERPYGHDALGSKYQRQEGPTPSAYWRNFADGEAGST